MDLGFPNSSAGLALGHGFRGRVCHMIRGGLQYKWVITIEYIQSNSVSLSEF